MLTLTCARGVRRHTPPKKKDKNNAIWCMLSVPKYVIINLKSTIFRIINQQPIFCAIFSPRSNQIFEGGIEAKDFFNKSNAMKAFLLKIFVLIFCRVL